MKIKLFNYFLSKAALKEQELLHLESEKSAFLAIILSRLNIQHRHATGCSSETVYMANPKFAEELFILVCVDAAMHGEKNLAAAFDFNFCPFYHRGTPIDDVTDKDISKYLNAEIYPKAKKNADKAIYAELLGKQGIALDEKLCRMNPLFIRNVFVEPLVMPEPCAETETIDRAWKRLTSDENFIKLLQPYTKYDHNGLSLAQTWYAAQINCVL